MGEWVVPPSRALPLNQCPVYPVPSPTTSGRAPAAGAPLRAPGAAGGQEGRARRRRAEREGGNTHVGGAWVGGRTWDAHVWHTRWAGGWRREGTHEPSPALKHAPGLARCAWPRASGRRGSRRGGRRRKRRPGLRVMAPGDYNAMADRVLVRQHTPPAEVPWLLCGLRRWGALKVSSLTD